MKAMLVVYLDDGTNLEELSADIHITNYVEDRKVKYIGNAEVLPIPNPREWLTTCEKENFYNKGWNDCLRWMLGNMYEVDDLKKWRQETNESNVNN